MRTSTDRLAAGFYVTGHSAETVAAVRASPAYVVIRRPGAGEPVHMSIDEARALSMAINMAANDAEKT